MPWQIQRVSRLSVNGESKAIEIEGYKQIQNAIGAVQVHPVIAPATDDGRRSLAHFQDVVIVHRTNRIRVLEHHFWISRNQSEKIEHYESLKAELLGKAQNSP
jgi:hypothetical protein